MSYVLTWPSEYGPCMLRVSRRAFVARSRMDPRLERSCGVLRYPPPGWIHVIRERGSKPSLARRLFVLVCGAALCGGFLGVGYQIGGLHGGAADEAVQQVPKVVSLRRMA